MSDQPTRIEMNVPADQVDATVASVCAEWGVDRAEVGVDVEPYGLDGSTVRLMITLHEAGDVGGDLEAVDDAALDDDLTPGDDQPLDPALAQARGTLGDLLRLMKVRAEVEAAWGEADALTGERAIVLDVRGDDLGMLIGRKGETLAALQYMTRLILSKQMNDGVDVVVDVQGHKRRREEQIRRMARRMAEQAAERQRTMTMEPMPPNERRIVHIELRDHPSVRTESVGEGHARKVTIIPK